MAGTAEVMGVRGFRVDGDLGSSSPIYTNLRLLEYLTFVVLMCQIKLTMFRYDPLITTTVVTICNKKILV